MIEKVLMGLKDPQRVLFRAKQKIFSGINEESLLDNSIRNFHSNSISKKIFYVKSQFDYGDKNRGMSYEENNYLHSFVSMGYDVIAFDPIHNMKLYGKKTMNKLLKECIFRYNPDIVFFVLFNDEIEFSTLTEIKDEMKIRTMNWFGDDHWRFEKYSKYYAPYFSYVITTYKKSIDEYKKIGCKNIIYSQYAYNHYLYRKLCLPYKYDVTFVGQPHSDRKIIIDKIRKESINVETFGFGWQNGSVSAYEMIRIFNQSKININLSNASRGNIKQIKGRDFEVPGSNGFLITGYNEDLEEFFSLEKDIVTYKDIDELIHKIKYYLLHEDEREQIQSNGYIKAKDRNTYKTRFEEIFSNIKL